MGLVLWTLLHAPVVIGVSPVLFVAVVAAAAVAIVVLIRRRDSFPPIRLARRYGILPQLETDDVVEPVTAGR
jgi:hypothetical protein